MYEMDYEKSLDDTNIGLRTYEFVFMFNKSTGSPKVYYFMVDPWMSSKLFPKCNVMNMNKVKNLVHFSPVVVDDCLFIIGGKDWETGEFRNDIWRYDPANGHWSARAKMSIARCRFRADVLNGCIYVTGGEIHGGKITEHCECYDPVKDKWKPIQPLPKPRADHASCVSGMNIYISGGISNLKHQCSSIFWVYDPLTNDWTEPMSGIILPHEREKHIMVPVGKKIYFLGGRGFDQETFSEKDEAAVCSYDTRNNGKLRGEVPPFDIYHPNLTNPRANGGYVLLGRNIYLLGGKSYQKDSDVVSVESYNTKRRKSREMFTLPDSYSFHNVECVVLKVPSSNKDVNFTDLLLYDKWIMW